MKLLRILAKPTALEIAARELEQAKRDLLTHSALREYYMALEEMLGVRIARLEQAVHDLAAPTPQPPVTKEPS
jgi:hypothetical protein